MYRRSHEIVIVENLLVRLSVDFIDGLCSAELGFVRWLGDITMSIEKSVLGKVDLPSSSRLLCLSPLAASCSPTRSTSKTPSSSGPPSSSHTSFLPVVRRKSNIRDLIRAVR